MALIEALREWEAQWRATGAPVDRKLRAGHSEVEIRDAFDGPFLHQDVITWFSWCGGVADGVDYFPLPPSACDPLTLEAVRRWSDTLRVWVPHRSGSEYDPALIPLMVGDDSYTLLIDRRSGEVLRFENLNAVEVLDPPLLKVSDDLETLVRRWIAINEVVCPTWSIEDDDVFDFDRSRLSIEDQRLVIVYVREAHRVSRGLRPTDGMEGSLL